MRVTLSNVGLCYSGATRNAVQDINLDINDGEFLVLCGPVRCCGKSTHPAHAGRSGTAHQKAPWHLITTTSPPCPPPNATSPWCSKLRPLSAHDCCRQHGVRAQERQNAQRRTHRAHPKAAGIVGHRPVLGPQTPTTVRRSAPTRSAMGRAIVRNPQVFLMDEPLSNLRCQIACANPRPNPPALQRNLGVTTVYVTHDQPKP